MRQKIKKSNCTCFTSLLVFFIARQNVLTRTMAPLQLFPRRQNAFNTLSRAHLAKSLLQNQQSAANSCLLSPEARPDSDSIDLGHDILWKHFQSNYGCKGVLKFYHHGSTRHILSESGVQQDDPLGSALVALGNHPCLVEIAQRHPADLVTVYADNTFSLGPLQAVT